MNSPRFPILVEMVLDVLAIPVSSVASESAFSMGGHILDSFRSSLTPKLVQALLCCQDWLQSDSLPIEIEEDLNYFEQFELDLTESGSCSRVIDIYYKLPLYIGEDCFVLYLGSKSRFFFDGECFTWELGCCSSWRLSADWQGFTPDACISLSNFRVS